MTYLEDFYVSTNDIKQYSYCERIAFYNHVLDRISITYSMEKGKKFQDSIKEASIKKALENRGYTNIALKFDVFLASKKLELKGKLDCLAQCEQGTFPIEIKYSNNPLVYSNQLISYALLVEKAFSTVVNTAYFYFGKEKNTELTAKNINEEEKTRVITLIKRIKTCIITGERPSPTLDIFKCQYCEFKNFCDDVI
ncbi:MAG: CRISPR-associated protein Cas4 [Thermodesulfobium sp.]